AAIMRNLDLVISCDTATAHLAGALGVPVWVVLPFAPDWRWMLGRPDSPWYPSARLFRQSRLDDWDEVFQRMAHELRSRAPQQPIPAPPGAASPTPATTVSTAKPAASPPPAPGRPIPGLAEAIKLHQAGDIDQAEPIYRQILE